MNSTSCSMTFTPGPSWCRPRSPPWSGWHHQTGGDPCLVAGECDIVYFAIGIVILEGARVVLGVRVADGHHLLMAVVRSASARISVTVALNPATVTDRTVIEPKMFAPFSSKRMEVV